MPTFITNKSPSNLKRYHKQNKKEKKILKYITTIHGTNHSSLNNKFTSKLWYLLLTLNLLTSVVLVMVVRRRFNTNQIVTEMFSDTKVNVVPFPAVSICNYNAVSHNESRSIAALLKKNERSEKEIKDFLNDLFYLKTYSYGTPNGTINSYSEIMKILKSHYYNVQTMMAELSQKCENMLVYCEFNGKRKDCENIFNLIQTYQGFCCAFNYAALNDVDSSLDMEDEDFEYYIDRNNNEKTEIITTSQAGRTSGLKVVINVEPKEYQGLLQAYGAVVLVSDPNDYPETTVQYKHVEMGESLTMKVEPYIYKSDPSLRTIPSKKRGCWFNDEVVLEHTARYSFETCNTECRMASYLDHCGCLPYKYPAADPSTRYCELSDLACLRDLIAHSPIDKQRCKPECFLECSDKTYSVTSDTVPFHVKNVDLSSHDVSELSSVHVYFVKPTCNTYKQSLLIDTIYYIGTYGGVLSWSFGGSLITVLEILYLIIFAVIHIICNTYKKYIQKNKIFIK